VLCPKKQTSLIFREWYSSIILGKIKRNTLGFNLFFEFEICGTSICFQQRCICMFLMTSTLDYCNCFNLKDEFDF
jgi:hypothetical protein